MTTKHNASKLRAAGLQTVTDYTDDEVIVLATLHGMELTSVDAIAGVHYGWSLTGHSFPDNFFMNKAQAARFYVILYDLDKPVDAK